MEKLSPLSVGVALAITFAFLVLGYPLSEWAAGRDLATRASSSNLIQLVDYSFITCIGNRVVTDLFVRERRNRQELKAANEEAMSMNEEFQSTNEELETSKEELQSLNEELTTLNAQLQHKIEEERLISDDLSNLLASSDIATVFLDAGLKIKRFTQPAIRSSISSPVTWGVPLAISPKRWRIPNS